MRSSDEGGSCLYVYTYSSKYDDWLSEGHILYGMNAKCKEGLDEIKLKRFKGTI